MAKTITNIKAVLSSFMGIRKHCDSRRDFENLKFWQVVVTGIAMAAIFVASIIFIVYQIV